MLPKFNAISDARRHKAHDGILEDTVIPSNRQFTISQLLWTMAILAITLSIVPKAPFFVATSSVISLFWVFGLANTPQGRNLLVLLTVVLPIEFCCGLLAFHTIGEIVSAFYRLLLLLNVAFLVAFVVGLRRFAFVAILLLAFCMIPHQLTLAVRWWCVHNEAVRVAEFAKQTKNETGAFPIDLSAYRFRNTNAKQFISYRGASDSFLVSYYVGTPNTSHWCDNGKDWEYYPD
ncbi:MAG: hypothetical protein R3E01_07485 [Pirellulaceae bacterium]